MVYTRVRVISRGGQSVAVHAGPGTPLNRKPEQRAGERERATRASLYRHRDDNLCRFSESSRLREVASAGRLVRSTRTIGYLSSPRFFSFLSSFRFSSFIGIATGARAAIFLFLLCFHWNTSTLVLLSLPPSNKRVLIVRN